LWFAKRILLENHLLWLTSKTANGWRPFEVVGWQDQAEEPMLQKTVDSRFAVYVCMYVCMYECMNVWMYECMNVWMYECMYVCMYVRIRVTRFTHCLIVYFCFENLRSCLHFRAIFPWLRLRNYFGIKCVGLHFRKLIWSPWYECTKTTAAAEGRLSSSD
jgi:hypothetical protein